MVGTFFICSVDFWKQTNTLLELCCAARTVPFFFSSSDKIRKLNKRYLSKYLTFSWADYALGYWNSCPVVTKLKRALQFVARIVKILLFPCTVGREWNKFARLKKTSCAIRCFSKTVFFKASIWHAPLIAAFPHLFLPFPVAENNTMAVLPLVLLQLLLT